MASGQFRALLSCDPPYDTLHSDIISGKSNFVSEEEIFLAYSPRILIVDNEAAVLRLFEAVLAQDGYYVTAVASGRQALISAGGTVFDVIISEMSLPDMDGTELIRHIRIAFPSSKVLAVSGYMTSGITRNRP